jgi:peptidase M50-like protein
MDVLGQFVDLFLETAARPWLFLLIPVLWAPLLVSAHEAAHALTALEVTTGRVAVIVGGGPNAIEFERGRWVFQLTPWAIAGGQCMYEPETLRSPRDEARIAAAGPLASLAIALVLAVIAVTAKPFAATLAVVLMLGGTSAFVQFLLSALPLRYGAGLTAEGDSDGLAVWRILTGSFGPSPRTSERAAHPVFLVLLALLGVLAVLTGPGIALVLGATFVGAWLLQRSEI